MRRIFRLSSSVIALSVIVVCAGAQDVDEKIVLEEPQAEDLATELADLPDGVLKVKTNPDGSFKSLIVKTTVEIEDVLGANKGKRLARSEAEIQCRGELSRWLNEGCVFVEAMDKTTTIITKGEATKDAAGNTVKLRTQEGKEFKAITENAALVSAAWLRGLVVLHTEITDDSMPEYMLIMGLSQKTLNQSKAVKDALEGKGPKPSEKGKTGLEGEAGHSDTDIPGPEKKTNPEASEFL